MTVTEDSRAALAQLETIQSTNADLKGARNLELIIQLLKSPFFQSVAKVYDAFQTSLPAAPEAAPTPAANRGGITATSQAVENATVAAFGAGDETKDHRVIVLTKGTQGLGFNIMGGAEQNCPIFISRIAENGVAFKDGNLKRGDQLQSVNGIDVTKATHERAVEILKSSVGSVTLTVKFNLQMLEELERMFAEKRESIKNPK
ncbi:veli-PA [Capsaspora owczarzaki ATCC 30864]|uniref:Veli-PA n=1 Tax=Capsaspora owczarzaki (strain ATCC 30864) TaxID=595528 RepID=A0A0D2VYL3_CAPO3|nr:veli-PA [Capsaspora owczarzaki ATCC 30864]KJE96822.1 veli-PA [Capsaspora owczarzaki ATCC 30864]|eukprot:XP_004343811.1 veli-PA [Capsaspora owczarzaki ATCC 30864]